MSLSTDVFVHEILSSSDFDVIYQHRHQYPQIYQDRVGAPNEILLKFLVAIEHDDIDLFDSIWPRDDDDWYGDRKFIFNLVMNLITLPTVNQISPRKIFRWLMSVEHNMYDLSARLAQDPYLLLRITDDPSMFKIVLFYNSRHNGHQDLTNLSYYSISLALTRTEQFTVGIKIIISIVFTS
jgi:hypothetical protein